MSGSSSISSSSTFFDLSDAMNAPYNAKVKLPASRKPRKSLRTTATGPDKGKPLWESQQKPSSQSTQTPKAPSSKRARDELAESLSLPLGTPNPRARKQARRTSPRTKLSKTHQVPFMTLGNRRLSTPRRMSPPIIDLTISPSPGSPSEDPVLLIGTTTRTGKRKRDRESGPSSPTVSVNNVADRSLQPLTPPPRKIPKRESISPGVIRSPRPLAHSPHLSHPVIQDENDSYEGETPSDSGNSEQCDADVGYLDENYGFIGDAFEVPTQRGSPSPETLYERSFTKLGQRKPTPRRLVLEGEGDLSTMAKTVYYEHDEGQVEAPSPSPSSRRRNRVRAVADTTARGSPRSYPRILDALNSDAQEQERRDDPQLSFDEADSDKSGYIHDPTGFEVLEEETPENSQEGEEDGNEYRKSQSIPLPPSSTPPFDSDQLESQDSTKKEGDDDPWGKSLDERQPEVEPTITMRFDPSQELPAGRTPFDPGLEDRFRENQVPFSSSPIQSVSTQHDSPSTDRIQVQQSVAYDSLEDDSTHNSVLLQTQRLDDGCADERVPPKSSEGGEYYPEHRHALSFSQSPTAQLQNKNKTRSSPRSSPHEPPFVEEAKHAKLSYVGASTVVPATVPVEIPKIRIGDEEIGSYDETEEEGGHEEGDSAIIEVSSLDPKAAARAAVILKMHHDYILEGGQDSTRGRLGRSRSRQHTSARYSRSRSEDVTNASIISLPELLQEAEEVLNRSVTMSPGKRASFLPRTNLESSTVPTQRQKSEATSLSAQNLLSLPSGWCKDDWKNMERAFVRERKIIAQRNGLKSSSQVDPSSVILDDVVDRFVISNELSARSRVGPEFERETLLLRAAALQRRLVKVVFNSRYATPIADLRPMIPETPSTFGDDFDYGRSSRQSSVRRSPSAQSLPPSLQAPHYAHLHNEANASRSVTTGRRLSSSSFSSRNDPKDPLLVTPTAREERATSSPSVTSRLLSYVGLGRGSATPPRLNSVHGATPDVFKVPREPASSSNTMGRGISPEIVRLRHSGPITLPQPLRRASNAPIQNLSVRLSREYEEFPELRHVDPPSYPSTTSPPSKHLRNVSSSGSVKDLVKGFEYLTQEEAIRSTPISSRAPSLMNRWDYGRARSDSQFSVKSSSSADFTGSLGRNNSLDISGEQDVDNTFEHSHQRCDAPSSTATTESIAFLQSSASANAAVPLPKQNRIPTTAPPKKRLSLFSWL